MNRAEFERKIEEIKSNMGKEPMLASMAVAVIVLLNRAVFIVQTWTVQTDDQGVHFIEVHCQADSTPMFVPYAFIKEVLNYDQLPKEITEWLEKMAAWQETTLPAIRTQPTPKGQAMGLVAPNSIGH